MSNETGCDDNVTCGDLVTSEQQRQLNYSSLWLLFFPVVTLFGNVLVCLSVLTERSLHTATNYFIFSLAIADIMVAILVMPLAVYVEVNQGEWHLGDALCDTWVAFDVLCCTASILNLAAISFDRFIAITRPLRYAKHRTKSRRVMATIAATWIVSAAISSPIAFGMNYTERRRHTPHLCTFYNSDFLIFSSMGSFYIPCVVMLGLYWRMFSTIRQRARESVLRKGSSRTGTHVQVPGGGGADGGNCGVEITIGPDNNHTNGQTPLSNAEDSCRAALLSPTSATDRRSSYHFRSDDDVIGPPLGSHHRMSINIAHVQQQQSTSPEEDEMEENNGISSALEMLPIPCAISGPSGLPAILLVNPPSTAAVVGTPEDDRVVQLTSTTAPAMTPEAKDRQELTKSLISRLSVTRINFYMRYLPTGKRKDRSATKRERKATKTLAIVLAVFLFCWAPFFTINIVNAVCIRYAAPCDESVTECTDTCRVDPLILTSFVWLGYINSALNPVIYTIYNIEFRRAFHKLLRMSTCCL